MKQVIIAITAFLASSQLVAQATDFDYISLSTEIDPSARLNDLVEPYKDYIAVDFQPIVLKFESGDRVPSDYEITVEVEFEVRILKVADIEAELNQIERQLNAFGRSLRDLGEEQFNFLTHIPVDREKLLEQQRLLTELMRRFDPNNMRERLTEAELEKLVQNTIEQVKGDILVKVRDLVQDQALPKLDLPEFELPSLTTEKKFEIPEFNADKVRTWSFVEGDPKVVAAHGSANLRTQGLASAKSKKASGQLDGKFGVYLMKQPQIVLGEGYARFESPQRGNQTAEARFAILGREIYKRTFEGENPKWGQPYNKGVDKHYRFDFPCGPIQCLVTLGARGNVFFNWSAGIGAMQAYGSADAGISAHGYAQAEATVVGIAGVGAEGELLIVRDTLSLDAHASVRLDDRDMPFVEVGIQADNTIEALNGSISTYAYISLPECRSGNFMGVSYPRCSVEKKKASHLLFDWAGYRHHGNILNFYMRLSPFGYEIDGRPEDIRPEDIRQIQELQAQIDRMELVDRENQLIRERNRYLQEERNAFTRLAGALQSRQAKAYESALKQQDDQLRTRIEAVKSEIR